MNDKNKKIPSVVHMIWYGVDAPSPLHHPNEKYRRGYESIVKKSMCEIKLWTKSDCEYLVQQYPEYEGIYHTANNIMKYDIMRYLIVYHCGGTYLDADIILKKSLENIYLELIKRLKLKALNIVMMIMLLNAMILTPRKMQFS